MVRMFAVGVIALCVAFAGSSCGGGESLDPFQLEQALVSGDVSHSLHVDADGKLWAWGWNASGQLGDGTKADRSLPGEVSGIDQVIDAAGGSTHTLAIRSDGTVWAWGSNGAGRLGLGSGVIESLAPTQIPGLTDVVSLAAGCCHSMALRSDGTVWAWGMNTTGQLGTGGTAHEYAPIKVPGLSGIVAIASGYDHSLALSGDGTVWAWGANWAGALGDGTTITRSTPGSVGAISGAGSIAGGRGHSLAVLADGSVWGWGAGNSLTPAKVNGLVDIEDVSAGLYFSLALDADHTVWAWGGNASGQLGDGTTTIRSTPVQVPGLTGVVAISTGVEHSLAERSDHSVWAWGSNANGRLGDGTTTNRLSPVQVIGPTSSGDPVSFGMPSSELYWGTYRDIPIHIDGFSGLAIDDLVFEVPDGPAAGHVSYSRSTAFDPAHPTIMLLVGSAEGTHDLIARDPQGAIVGTGQFTVTTSWTDDTSGPSSWFMGVNAAAYSLPDPNKPISWGRNERTGPYTVGILLVDTDSERYDAAALLATEHRYTNAIPIVEEYFTEVSARRLNLQVEFIESPPISLPGDWEDYFEDVQHPQGFDVWRFKNRLYLEAIGRALNEGVEFKDGTGSVYDSIVFVTRTVDPKGVDAEKAAWPYASHGTKTFFAGPGLFDFRTAGMVSLASDEPTAVSRLAHEILHNMGLDDLYTNTRRPTGWDIMDRDQDLPHLSVPHKNLLGWTDPERIHLINQDSPDSGTNIIHKLWRAPINNPTPAGFHTALEIELGDGLRHSIEYRSEVAGEIADQQLHSVIRGGATSALVGMEVTYLTIQRPVVPPLTTALDLQLIEQDAFGNGPVFRPGDLYAYQDVAFATPDFDMVMLAEAAPDFALVDVSFDLNSRPDPYIRPWPSKMGKYVSLDLLVENARTRANPSRWYNVPLREAPNDVFATVHNRGTSPVDGLKVEFYVVDFSTDGAGPEVHIGDDTINIPPGGSADAHAIWNVPRDGRHFCVIARFAEGGYVHPVSGIPEPNAGDNAARTNYFKLISSTASPWSREGSAITVTNPLDVEAVYTLEPTQNNPHYRTYLEKRWVRLGPGETTTVDTMVEFVGVPGLDDMRHEPLRFDVEGFISPIVTSNDHPLPTGGLTIEVEEGLRTDLGKFDVVDSGGEVGISGAVVITKTGLPAPDGAVILTFREPGVPAWEVVTSQTAGTFNTSVQSGTWTEIYARYVAPAGYAPAESRVVANPMP